MNHRIKNVLIAAVIILATITVYGVIVGFESGGTCHSFAVCMPHDGMCKPISDHSYCKNDCEVGSPCSGGCGDCAA